MATLESAVTGIVSRTMREHGFIGDIKVSNVRRNKSGYSARVKATVGTATVPYRARIVGTKVTVTKVVPNVGNVVPTISEVSTRPDEHGNVIAKEGCTRCDCGAKYWENDQCIDCGTHASKVINRQEG